jgi:thioredoxin-dependent peroxiredoxin
MRRLMCGAVTALALVASGATAGHAQTPAPTAPASQPPLEIGALAPDFELPGATRYGVLSEPVKLSDYKGEVVVLAFFFKARTKG